jgi:hypothetical protein
LLQSAIGRDGEAYFAVRLAGAPCNNGAVLRQTVFNKR